MNKITTKYFENEGYHDYGWYLYINDEPVTIPASECGDPRYPPQLVFSSEGDAYSYVLTKFFKCIVTDG